MLFKFEARGQKLEAEAKGSQDQGQGRGQRCRGAEVRGYEAEAKILCIKLHEHTDERHCWVNAWVTDNMNIT